MRDEQKDQRLAEEYQRTPRRKNRPMEDWDRYKELHVNQFGRVKK